MAQSLLMVFRILASVSVAFHSQTLSVLEMASIRSLAGISILALQR